MEGLFACTGEVVVAGIAQGFGRTNLDAGSAKTALIVIYYKLGGRFSFFAFQANTFHLNAKTRACFYTQITRHTERLVAIGNFHEFDRAAKPFRHLNRFVRILYSDGGLEEVLESDSQTNKQASKSSENF